MKAVIAGLTMLTMACTTVPAEGDALPPADATDQCNAAAAQSVVGKPASDATAEEARRLSGASTVRYLRPGQIVTMEYRGDRLNLKLDASDRIEAVTCG